MQEVIDAGGVYFGPDHTTAPAAIAHLEELDSQVAESVFVQDRNSAPVHLTDVLGDKRFPNPKDYRVLMRWIDLIAPTDGVILDFFGGSGSSAEAVMRLNAQDDGTRQAILVTNNELGARDSKQLARDGLAPGDSAWEALGVFERVTRPRLSTVLTGAREDGSTYDQPGAGEYPQRVEFFDLTYIAKDRVEAGREFARISPLLWMRAGALGDLPARPARAPYVVTDALAVLFDTDAAGTLADELETVPGVRLCFIVANSTTDFSRAAGVLPAGVRARHLWNDYLGSRT